MTEARAERALQADRASASSPGGDGCGAQPHGNVELTLPESLRDVEPVRSVRTPARLEYTYTAGEASTRFLRGVARRKIIGARAEAPGAKVYVPPRGADPQLGKPTTEQVELGHGGTVTSFCIVNLQFYGSAMEIPYTSALILLDGADQTIMHLIQECPVEQVRPGMRVEAVWVDDDQLGPTLESIRYFRPTGEPDVEVRIPGEDTPLWLLDHIPGT